MLHILLNSDSRRTATLITLRSHNLVVMSTQVHSQLSPGIEVVLSCNSSPNPLGLPNGPVLRECGGSFDRSGVGPGSRVNIVCGSVRGDSALVRTSTSRVIVAVGFHDVILDQRIGGPTVDGEVAVAIGSEGTAIGDVPGLM